jgi:hypothetical protein
MKGELTLSSSKYKFNDESTKPEEIEGDASIS